MRREEVEGVAAAVLGVDYWFALCVGVGMMIYWRIYQEASMRRLV